MSTMRISSCRAAFAPTRQDVRDLEHCRILLFGLLHGVFEQGRNTFSLRWANRQPRPVFLMHIAYSLHQAPESTIPRCNRTHVIY
jgi:hypothetical protein